MKDFVPEDGDLRKALKGYFYIVALPFWGGFLCVVASLIMAMYFPVILFYKIGLLGNEYLSEIYGKPSE